MIITVFRSRLNEANADAYATRAAELSELARTLPGYISHKAFTAADGERCTIVEFADAESQAAWARETTHLAAKAEGTAGAAGYYTEYDIKIGEVERSHSWKAEASDAESSAAGA